MSALDDYLYDRHGQPITWEQYTELKYQSDEYRRIGSDRIGDAWVSTVWLGIDHGLGSRLGEGRLPIIFETMVFGGPMDGECWRYSHEAEALAGHVVVVEQVRAVTPMTGRERHKRIKYERDERRRKMKALVKELGETRR